LKRDGVLRLETLRVIGGAMVISDFARKFGGLWCVERELLSL
jgi:hypothetical protein